MKIRSINDIAFRTYGRVIREYDFSALLKKMEETPCPENEVIYTPSSDELERIPGIQDILKRLYGDLPAQIGYCNGSNRLLNALEYHRSSEIDIAVNDLILLLGRQQDIEPDHTYDTGLVEAFLVPAGTAVELYATTLHYAPCSVEKNCFRCVVILPKDTNTELDHIPDREGEDRLITAKNKWLIAHPDARIEGSFEGLKGENLLV